MLVCHKIEFKKNLFDSIAQKSDTASFFQTGNWLDVWLRHFDKKNLFLGIFDKDNLLGIAPLYISNSIAGFVGTQPVSGGQLLSDYGDILAVSGREKEVWETVFYKIKNHELKIKNLEFNFVREDSPSFKILKNLEAKFEEIEVAPKLELPSSFEDYLILLDRHSRHEIKRKIKRAEKEGVKVINFAGEEGLVDKMLELIALSSPEKKQFLNPEITAFFRDMMTTLFPMKALKILFLEYHNLIIAGLIIFHYKDEYLLYNSGFDPEYSFLSPGFVLKVELVKKAIGEGIKKLDFLRGSERIKYDLGGKERKLYKLIYQI